MLDLISVSLVLKDMNNPQHVGSNEDIIRQQQAKIQLLEEQLALLKKLDLTERRLVNSCVNLSVKENYNLIHEMVSKENRLGTISDCCTMLNFSRSGYYNYLKNIEVQQQRENIFGITFKRKRIQRIMRK